MPWYLGGVYVHLVSGVLLGGYVLFWLVMATGLRADHDLDSTAMLRRVGQARWPPFVLPRAARVPVLGLGWLLILLMLGSGVGLLAARGMSGSQVVTAALAGSGFARIVLAKLVLLGVLAVAQVRLWRRPGAGAALVAAVTAVILVCLSALLV